MNKIFTIKNRKEKISEEDLILLLKSGLLTGDDYFITADLDEYLRIKDSMYGYYLEEKK